MSYATVPDFVRQRLLATSGITDKVGNRVHYQQIPQSSKYPHIWFTRRGSFQEKMLDADGILEDRFVIEVLTPEFDEGFCTALVEALDIDGVQLENMLLATSDLSEMDDDYQFESASGDAALCMHAFVLTIYVIECE